MPASAKAVPRNLASKTKKPPASAAIAHPRRKCSLAAERAEILKEADNSDLHARISYATAARMPLKVRSKWEQGLITLIKLKTAFSPKTKPMTKRYIAAFLGCCTRTVDNAVSRLRDDGLIGLAGRESGAYGTCYYATDQMIKAAPDQVDEEDENNKNEASEEKAKPDSEESEEVNEQLLASQMDSGNGAAVSEEQSMRKGVRILSYARLVLPGRESAPVAVPEGVQIRSVRVAETAESDMTLSWSDAVIDEQGEITVWVHGCRKKTATPQNESIPTAQPKTSDEEVLRQVFELRFKKRVAAHEARALGPKITPVVHRAGGTLDGFFVYVRDEKFPEKDRLKYTVTPPLMVEFAHDYARELADAQEERASLAQRAAVDEAASKRESEHALQVMAYDTFRESWARNALAKLTPEELDGRRGEARSAMRADGRWDKLGADVRKREVEHFVQIALEREAPSMEEWERGEQTP